MKFDDKPKPREGGYVERCKGYGWIKVKKDPLIDEADASWQERFEALQAHHIEETTFLIEKVRELAALLDVSLDVCKQKEVENICEEYWW